ncbi:hypothetical protein [Elizabethkingia miricola]|uniref:hypothetical protein n=1 Tax=Elizabethkingia miricola TaxID=172045 RepID=UPI00293D190A|nr:hypothetical protein [Elizabethkingia miricola]MDV3462901.1 hypothetical protein [Elizabethkingia anophelis]WQM38074.1 hypothetical protein U2S95_17115 [Elizabethkingia miricola]
MKLLLITAIEEFETDVINILKHSGVKAFSYQSVKGFKNNKNEMSNWFGKDDIAVNSLLFTVFSDCNCVDDIYKNVNEFNQKQKTVSRIHIATINLENENFK